MTSSCHLFKMKVMELLSDVVIRWTNQLPASIERAQLGIVEFDDTGGMDVCFGFAGRWWSSNMNTRGGYPLPFSHNHGSVENHPKNERKRMLEIHPFSTKNHDSWEAGWPDRVPNEKSQNGP